jgi:acyl-CoA thioester hydrolase
MDTKSFGVETGIEVKSYDIDIVGHVNNIVYIRWMEDLRLKILEHYLPYDRLMEQGISPVLLRTEIDYRKAVNMFEPVVGKAWISGFEGIRMHIQFEFEVDGVVRAAGRQIGVFFNLDRQKPVRPPRDFLKRFYSSSADR